MEAGESPDGKMKFNLLPPAIVIYTDDLPEGVGGQAVRCVVSIRPKYEHDEGLLHHELTHVWQWWLTLFLHSILYPNVRRYRLRAEAMAYRVQMRYPDANGVPLTLDGAVAKLMALRYDLGLTVEEARRWLQ